MEDGKRSQSIEGNYKKNSFICFYIGTIIIGEDNNLSGSVIIKANDEDIQGSLEGRLEKFQDKNYLIFELTVPHSKQYHILRQQDCSEDIIGKYIGRRYGINNTQEIAKKDLLLKMHPQDIPKELIDYSRGGSISYIGVSENRYSWNKGTDKIKKFLGIK